MRRMIWLVSLVLAMLTVTRGAWAWDGQGMWYQSASGSNVSGAAPGPGGGGVLGTGSLHDYNITCANCHIKGAGQIDVKLTFDGAPPPAMYTPGHTYAVVGTLVGEHLGLSGCQGSPPAANNNNFAVTAEDDSGNLAGAFTAGYGSTASCPPDAPTSQSYPAGTVMYSDCHAVLTTGSDLTSWTLSWTAPPAGAGNVTFYFAAVDGNCMMDSMGDDVKVANVAMAEGTMARAPGPRNGRTTLALFGLLPVLGFVGSVRRRRARRP